MKNEREPVIQKRWGGLRRAEFGIGEWEQK